jgi:N-acetylglucosamine kinase-like BadF-type ATPase
MAEAHAQRFLIALEGGGTRSQAVLMDTNGRVIGASDSSDVNTNFVAYDQARQAVWTAVSNVLQASGVAGENVLYFAASIVGPMFGAELFGDLCPNATYYRYGEGTVVFARAGIYIPNGISLVAATGATAWVVRSDTGQQAVFGGWGSLLGDEGSAYAMGLQGLRAAVRAYEQRSPEPTQMAEAVCQHFGLQPDQMRSHLVPLVYQKPLSRAEIAQVAPVVTQLASQGDRMAQRIVAKVADDLSNLALHAARCIFQPQERFDVVIAGGLVQAGEPILAPLRQKLAQEFPQAVLHIGVEMPAVALGRLALYHIQTAPPTQSTITTLEENP